MGRSFFTPGAANTIEDYRKAPEYYHALSDSHYAMTIRDGQYFQRRWQLDAAGKEIAYYAPQETAGDHGRIDS